MEEDFPSLGEGGSSGRGEQKSYRGSIPFNGRRRGKPKERGRGRGDRGERAIGEKVESADVPMITTASPSMRTPIILTKPEKVVEESQKKETLTVLSIQRRDEVTPTVTENIQVTPDVVVRANVSKEPSSVYSRMQQKQSSNEKSMDQGLAPTTSVSTISSGTPGTTHVDLHLPTGLAALQISEEYFPAESISLIDGNFQWSDKALETLMDQTDFVVVGCVGLQGSGKSTVMSMLADPKDFLDKSKLVFRPQKKSDMEKAVHRTIGVDIYVTKERLILLDTQPLLSPSMLDQYLRYDRKVPSEFGTAEICLEVQALQLLSFLYTVCNVVLVVQDYFTDLNLLNLLKTAEMLKPSAVVHPSQESSGIAAEEPTEHFPYVVLVYNCCDPQCFRLDVVESMCQVTCKMFEHLRIRIRGSASLMRTPLLPFYKSKLFAEYQDINLFLLPNFHALEDEDQNLLSAFRGHPSFSTLASVLRDQLAGMPREHITHHTLTEKNWFHYAARTWESVKKSPLIAEYHRLLTS